jgi:4-aminobutyrate aminotransferase
MASRVQNKCLEKDLLVLTTSVYETMRYVVSSSPALETSADFLSPCSFIPPLNITKEDMFKALDIIKQAITEVVHEG